VGSFLVSGKWEDGGLLIFTNNFSLLKERGEKKKKGRREGRGTGEKVPAKGRKGEKKKGGGHRIFL